MHHEGACFVDHGDQGTQPCDNLVSSPFVISPLSAHVTQTIIVKWAMRTSGQVRGHEKDQEQAVAALDPDSKAQWEFAQWCHWA